MTSVVKEYDLLKIAQAFKMLTSPDDLVATVASNSVATYARRFGRLSTVSASDKEAYLSGTKVGDRENRPPGCRLAQGVWAQVRAASARFGFRWNEDMFCTDLYISTNCISGFLLKVHE